MQSRRQLPLTALVDDQVVELRVLLEALGVHDLCAERRRGILGGEGKTAGSNDGGNGDESCRHAGGSLQGKTSAGRGMKEEQRRRYRWWNPLWPWAASRSYTMSADAGTGRIAGQQRLWTLGGGGRAPAARGVQPGQGSTAPPPPPPPRFTPALTQLVRLVPVQDALDRGVLHGVLCDRKDDGGACEGHVNRSDGGQGERAGHASNHRRRLLSAA